MAQPSPKLGPTLAYRLQASHEYDLHEVNIFLRGEPARTMLRAAAADSEADTADVVTRLQSEAKAAQADLLKVLKAKAGAVGFADADVSVRAAQGTESFWLTNAIGTTLSKDTLEELLARDDVTYVELNRRAPIDELLDATPTSGQETAEAPRPISG